MNDDERERLMKLIRETYPLKSDYEELYEMAHPGPWVWGVQFAILFGVVGALLIWGRG